MFEEPNENLSEIEKLHKNFIRDKEFIANLSPRTIESYKEVFARWKKYVNGLPTADNLDDFVVEMRKAGLSVTTCNISIRSFNSFLTWLSEKGHLDKSLRLKKLKEEKRVMRTFSDDQLQKLLNWRPKNNYDWRFYAMFCTLADTGIRIEELLTLKTEKINFDNLLLVVMGKGSKERVLPISIELRKILWRYATKYRNPRFKSDFFFPTRSGSKMTYFNFYKVFHRICEDLEIDPKEIDGAFHAFRRKFGRNYLQQGGNLFYLQKIFGHTDLTTTKLYIEVETEDLQSAHLKTSPLSRLKKKS